MTVIKSLKIVPFVPLYLMTTTNQHSPFKIYNASAGSGKTFSLVRDYLILLFTSKKPDAFRHILAITFTNKAVAEMKSRIVENLIGFSEETLNEDHKSMLNAVAKKTGLTTEELQTKSHSILKSLIHNYAAFEVSTIDGFTHRVLRTFAKDLGLPSNFEVTMQVDDILHEAVDKLIAKAGEDKLLTKILINFALSKADDDKSWDISRELYDIARLLSNETNLKHLKAIEEKSLGDFEAFSKSLASQKKTIESDIITSAESVFRLLNDVGISPEHAFTGKYGFKYFSKLKDGDYSGINLDVGWQKNLSDDSKPIYSKSSKELTSDQKGTLNNLRTPIAELFEKSKAYILQVDFIDRIAKNLIPLSLLNAIKAEVQLIKKERSLVLISEFNNTISEAISGQPAPFIYERLGERYRHFFIDEFQDTSELQWQNLIPLAENPLTSLDEQGNQGSLLIVGDAKQSIYRWRGGKAEQFIDLYNGKSPFAIPSITESLPNNFRSLPEVVNFNNRLFKHLASHFNVEDYKNLYEASPQGITKISEGYVNLKFFDVPKKEDEHEIFTEEVYETIKRCETLGYKKSDICILTRKRKEGVIIADYLSAKGVSLISSETLLIKNSAEVTTIVDVLRLTENPKDDATKVQLLQYLVNTKKVNRELTEFSIESLQKSPSEFYASLSSYGIQFNPKYLETLPLYDTLEYIINAFQLITTSDAYVQYFLDFAFDYASQNLGGITGFLEHWAQHEGKLSIVVPEGQDAVQLLTIHRSKGLEFPIVIFPYANEDLKNFKFDTIWADLPEGFNDISKAYISASTALENLDASVALPFETLSNEKHMDGINVLYVALTRAKEHLYVLGKKDIDKSGPKLKTISGMLIEFLQHESLWNDDQVVYEFGKPHSKVSAEKTTAIETVEQEQFLSTSFDERAITLATNSGRLWGTTIQEAKDEGILIHDIMAEIDTAADVEEVVQRFVNIGRVATERQQEISEKINSIVLHPKLQSYYNDNVINYNERDMVSDAGDILRPDRINILEDNTAVLIDYKTGIFNEKNEQQIIEYSKTLEAMGYQVSKRFLQYANDILEIKNV